MKTDRSMRPFSAALRAWRTRRSELRLVRLFGAHMLTDIGLRADELGPPTHRLEWLRATHGRG
jgi:uncharacterized protein YjiS (DUF1127 family)